MVTSNETPKTVIGLRVATTNIVGLLSGVFMYNDSVLCRFVIYNVGLSYTFSVTKRSGLRGDLDQYKGYMFYGNIFVFGLLWGFRVFGGEIHLHLGFTGGVDIVGLNGLTTRKGTISHVLIYRALGTPRGVGVPGNSSRFTIHGHVMTGFLLLYGGLYSL